MPITVDTKFSWDNDVTIFAAGDMSMEGDIQVQGMAMKASMSGTQNSIFDLDKSTGLSTLIQTLQDMTGELNVQGTSVPMTIKTEIKVTFTK